MSSSLTEVAESARKMFGNYAPSSSHLYLFVDVVWSQVSKKHICVFESSIWSILNCYATRS